MNVPKLVFENIAFYYVLGNLAERWLFPRDAQRAERRDDKTVEVIVGEEESQEREKRSQKREISSVSSSWMVCLSRNQHTVKEQDLASIAETHTLPLAEDQDDRCLEMRLKRVRLASKHGSACQS